MFVCADERPRLTQMSVCCCVCVCEKDGASVGVQEACWRRGVASKLQKKLIKNEKRERREGGEGRREWTEAVGGGQRGEENIEEEKKEGRGGEGMEGGKQCFIENGWTNSV